MRVIVSIILLGLVQAGMSEESYVVKNQSSLLSTSVNCVDAGEFALWVGSDKGINRIEITSDSISQVSARQTSKAVLSICNDNNYLWVGIAEKGLYLLNKKTYVFKGYFKKQLGLTTITNISKVGGKLFVKTKSDNNFVVDLSDTSLHSSDVSDPVKYNINGIISLKGLRYKATRAGLVRLLPTLKSDESTGIKDTAVKDLQKKIIHKKDKELVSSVILKPDSLKDHGQKTNKKEGDTFSYLWVLISGGILYSFLLVKIVSRKYKKDIKVLEDEVLNKMKQD